MKDRVDKSMGIVTRIVEDLSRIKPTESLRLVKREVRKKRNCSDPSGNSPVKILGYLHDVHDVRVLLVQSRPAARHCPPDDRTSSPSPSSPEPLSDVLDEVDTIPHTPVSRPRPCLEEDDTNGSRKVRTTRGRDGEHWTVYSESPLPRGGLSRVVEEREGQQRRADSIKRFFFPQREGELRAGGTPS